MEALSRIQRELKVPKGQKNSFGNYSYRSCSDILKAIKPLLQDGESILLTDEITDIGGRIYVKSTAYFKIGANNQCVSVDGYAREPLSKKGMDESQITGAASSYARKYALCGLFAIDDTKDADTDEYQKKQDNAPKEKPKEKKEPEETPAQKAYKWAESQRYVIRNIKTLEQLESWHQKNENALIKLKASHPVIYTGLMNFYAKAKGAL